ncbi:MAG: 50S ribosomal protein L7/L12 [Mycoplasmoidaceae bacterium]
MAKLTNQQVIDSLKEMTLMEINDLVKAIEKEFGVSAAAPVAAAAAPAANAEPSLVTLTLTSAGASKVAVIKIYREITGLGLMEAKNAVDKAPCVVKEGIKPEEAKELGKKFTDAGAKVEIK